MMLHKRITPLLQAVTGLRCEKACPLPRVLIR